MLEKWRFVVGFSTCASDDFIISEGEKNRHLDISALAADLSQHVDRFCYIHGGDFRFRTYSMYKIGTDTHGVKSMLRNIYGGTAVPLM